MPTLSVPNQPVERDLELPDDIGGLSVLDLVALCNKIYNKHKTLVESCGGEAVEQLLGGSPDERRGAIDAVQEALLASQADQEEKFRVKLRGALARANKSPAAKHLHTRYNEGLGVDVGPNTPPQKVNKAYLAAKAVERLEQALEDEEARKKAQGPTRVEQALKDVGLVGSEGQSTSDEAA